MEKDYSRVHRLLQLVHVINARRGVSVRDLVAEFACSERTVYRDLELLNDIGIPCVHDDASGGYVLRRGFFMPPVQLTFEEALALTILLEHVPRGGQVPYLDVARQAIHKVRSQLPEAVKREIEPLDGRVAVDLARGSGDDGARDVYERVRAAIAARRVLRCRYEAKDSSHPGTEEEVFDLRPYALWYCQRAWYVVGHHGGRDDVRQLRLNRFDYVEVTDRPYAIPDDFRLEAYLGNAWRMIRGGAEYRVVVHFDKGFAETASETRWHPSQAEEGWDADGGVTLSFRVAGLEEIVWWVLGYGPAAKVLEPPELAARVRDLAHATARRYAGPPAGGQ
jgi:proteasome accessory factor B